MSTEPLPPVGAAGAAGPSTGQMLAQQDQVIRQQARSRVQKLAPRKTALAAGAITWLATGVTGAAPSAWRLSAPPGRKFTGCDHIASTRRTRASTSCQGPSGC